MERKATISLFERLVTLTDTRVIGRCEHYLGKRRFIPTSLPTELSLQAL